jgi:hypothetical protein
MRSYRVGVFLLVCLLTVPGWGQQATSSQLSQSQTPAPQDPQAVAVLSQALTVAGGAAAIKAITDYTATGTVTYHWNPEEQGTITIQGLGLSAIRVDANLPSGTHSETVHDGQTSRKTTDGRLWQYPPPYPVPTSDTFAYQPPIFPAGLFLPAGQLAAVLNRPRYAITYKGIVQVDGNSVHDVQVQRTLPGQTQPDDMTQYHLIDFFIDPNTFQVVMTQDNVPKNVVHQVRYANYTKSGGVLVPFSIGEQMGGQRTRDIQLDHINFNTALQDSAFVIQ